MSSRHGTGLSDAGLAELLATHSSRPLPHTIGEEPSALLCIDVQNRNADPDFGHGPRMSEEGLGALLTPFYEHLARTVVPNMQRLQSVARRHGVEVIHARVAHRTRDGRDNSGRYRRMGIQSPADALDAQILPAVAPQGDEVVLEKITSSAFESTNLDRILRNLGIRNVIACGLVTNGCIESTVRSAADRDYAAVVVDDATAALEPRLHEHALLSMRLTFASVMSTEEMVPLLAQQPR